MASLVHPKERLYGSICAAVAALAYLAIVVLCWSDHKVFRYVIGIAVFLILSHGAFIGRIRGSAVRLSSRQFPEVYKIATRLAAEMGFANLPAIYVQQAGGALNAFATRFFGRSFVVVYSDVIDLAYESGEGALEFVIAHELGHLHRRHPTKRAIVLPAMFVPFLGSAYSRACEYTADRYGSRFAPTDAISGLLVLAAGKRLYRRMDAQNFREQADREKGFWTWYAEITESHPLLVHRVEAIAALRNSGT